MLRTLLALPIVFTVSGCEFFSNLTGPGPQPVVTADGNSDASMAETSGWDGSLLLCGETISFDKDATEPLPEFGANERLGFCTRTIKYLALHREYGDKTNFFGAAAEATGTFAIMNAAFMRRVYSKKTWTFMQQLSVSLDKHVDAASAELAGGAAGGQEFTDGIIVDVQADVQQSLDALQAGDPSLYEKILSELDGTYNPTNPMLVRAIEGDPFFSAYEAALAEIRSEVGGNVDFSNFEHRIMIYAGLGQMIENIPSTAAEPE